MLWLLFAPTTSGCSPPHRGWLGFPTRHHLLASQVLEMKTRHVGQTLPARFQMLGGLLVWDSSILNCGRVPRQQVPTRSRSQQRPRQGCQGVSEMRCTRGWRRASSEGLCCDSHAPTCTRRSRGASSPHFLSRERGFLRPPVRAGPVLPGAGREDGRLVSLYTQETQGAQAVPGAPGRQLGVGDGQRYMFLGSRGATHPVLPGGGLQA